MDLLADLADLVGRLRAAGCVFAEEEAALILAETDDPGRREQMVADRVAGLPLELVLGWADFGGLRVRTAAGVFVPRRRTLLLAREALGLLGPGDRVLDLCCGTGAVGAYLAAALPDLEVWAADLDPAAVACARRNLAPERVLEGDLYDALDGTPGARLRGLLAVVVANAPYVPTPAIALMPPEARDHEHRVALDGGPDGLDVQRRVVAGAPGWLAPGGSLLIETGAAQADRTAAAMRAEGFVARVVRDDEVDGTVVVGRRPGP